METFEYTGVLSVLDAFESGMLTEEQARIKLMAIGLPIKEANRVLETTKTHKHQMERCNGSLN